MKYGFSHRGYRRGAEENTLAAFQRAYAAGIRHFETDVRATSDQTVYAFHDETLERITAGTGRFNDLSAEQVGALRAGTESLATLEELINAFPDVMFNIDVKDVAVIAPLAKVIERTASHDRVALASFDTARTRATAHLLSRPVRTSPHPGNDPHLALGPSDRAGSGEIPQGVLGRPGSPAPRHDPGDHRALHPRGAAFGHAGACLGGQ
ncbi:glycerophosphodiester phosphodiesterase family protein [Arthrobacter sp. JCM 19049]|uniref:glycerophosphodiester phosphodiesterase family protein n=1 Tax=Arthrobacter sp. JCM 19049 TaxID=1460643 RepID=UPI0006CF6741|nr:glycerophosphodiester phosphodiesterase family protein [Arthrobacter sp. JCM 19049]